MGHIVIMLLTCLLVMGAMAATLWWFFRKLGAIERHMWGNTPDTHGFRAAVRRYRQRKQAAKAAKASSGA